MKSLFYIVNDGGELYNGLDPENDGVHWSVRLDEGEYYEKEGSAVDVAKELLKNGRTDKLRIKFLAPKLSKTNLKNPIMHELKN